MTNARLVDLSKWNGACDLNTGLPILSTPMIMDWEKARTNGVVGAIIRLGSIDNATGVCYTDGRLPEIYASAKANNIPVGFYFYYRPKFSGETQGNFIQDVLKDYPFELDVWIDVEQPGQYPDQARDSIKRAAWLVGEQYPGNVGIYTRQSIWDVNVSQDEYWEALPLWAARYKDGLTSPWSDNYFRFRDWDAWDYWQYSADNNGLAAEYGFPSGSKSIDLDYFNGDEFAFKTVYSLNPDPLEELKARFEALSDLYYTFTAAQAERNAYLTKTVNDLVELHNGFVTKQETENAYFRKFEERIANLEKWKDTPL